jgi:AraC-like DNA-binding protein
MHFAAQFRATTDLRPREYLLRRRIERAQEMLVGTGMSLVDVALSVGFQAQAQAHFTSVFKRYAGQPPRAWRESRGLQTEWTSTRKYSERRMFFQTRDSRIDVRLENRTGEPGRYISAPRSRFSLRQV